MISPYTVISGQIPKIINSNNPGIRKELKGVVSNTDIGGLMEEPSGAKTNPRPPANAPKERSATRTIKRTCAKSDLIEFMTSGFCQFLIENILKSCCADVVIFQ